METKKHEGHLLQYWVPQNGSDLNNELLVQLFKSTPLEGSKAKPGDYLSTNLISRKGGPRPLGALLKVEPGGVSGGALSRTSRDAFKCLNEAQLPCRGRQRWYCKQENGKWRKYKCREEKALLDDEAKQCVCFTAEGTIIKPYLVMFA